MTQQAGSPKKQHANLGQSFVWLLEAQVWMDTAVRLDAESNRPQRNGNYDANKLNVAHVCTGLAFELAYKSLLVAEFKPLEKTHSVEKLHEKLEEETQEIVEGYIKRAGWKDSTSLLNYLDERMTHPDRKYWMENPWKKGGGGVGFSSAPNRTIPELASILRDLVILASQKFKKAYKYLHDVEVSLVDYENAVANQTDLTGQKNKVLTTIKLFRNSYGVSVDLNKVIRFPVQVESEIETALQGSPPQPVSASPSCSV